MQQQVDLEAEILEFIGEKPTYQEITNKFNKNHTLNAIYICLEKLQSEKKIEPNIRFQLVVPEVK
jgi:hypothetical protein